mmetsp:Transcript_24689/g.72245  ORF Transcript_24689/g.72245 Transcript_24689/m.72245 type:complete len:193 (+) Transcript_24689:1558-2136(+)
MPPPRTPTKAIIAAAAGKVDAARASPEETRKKNGDSPKKEKLTTPGTAAAIFNSIFPKSAGTKKKPNKPTTTTNGKDPIATRSRAKRAACGEGKPTPTSADSIKEAMNDPSLTEEQLLDHVILHNKGAEQAAAVKQAEKAAAELAATAEAERASTANENHGAGSGAQRDEMDGWKGQSRHCRLPKREHRNAH